MKIYILTFTTALLFATGLLAQSQDSLLRRQMELERDFNPTLMDANKINSLPTLREPAIQKANTNYSSWAERTSPPLEIALPKPGTIMTDIPFSSQKGYISFAGGNYANMDGAFGYRLLDNDIDKLSVNFLHQSTNGNINYIQNSAQKSNKAYFMDNSGGLKYQHRFRSFNLKTDVSYLHSAFNYYGNSMETTRTFDNENQTLGVFRLNLGVKSHPSDAVEYKGHVDFKNFATKYGESLLSDGVKGNQINVAVDLSKPFNDGNNRIGLDGKLLNTFYNGDRKNYSLINAGPYLGLGGSNWKARLGADILFHLAGKTEARVVPNANLQVSVSERSSLYADLHGGYRSNTLLEMMNESRYVLPTVSVTPSFSMIDFEAGAKIGELEGFRFDIFGGFKQTDDEHFLLLTTDRDPDTQLPGLFDTHEYLTPYYANISHSHIGGAIQTNIWSPLNLSVNLKKNFYTLKDNKDTRAYNKPGFETDIRADFKATDELKFTLNYYFANDRWSNFDGSDVQMDNISDFNLGAIYKISDAFSINVKANNLLFQKYDIWYGHPAQGFNMMGGFSFRF